nr:monovalent cation/H+ antiporter complex subunit F [Micromonospora sp. DSM 115978]
MTVVVVLVTALLSVAALLALVRIVRGPSLLDRVVATDVLLAVVVGAVGVEAAINRHATTLPIMVVLAILGFVGSVGVVRFAARDEAVTAPGGLSEPGPGPDAGPSRHELGEPS